MIDKITAYNVGHGDCSNLENKESCMLVDFGGNKNINNTVNNLIPSISQFSEKNLMISHLHNDHYNGICKLNGLIFDNVYLPDYISGFGLFILGSALLTNNNYIIKQAKEILKIPQVIVNNNSVNNNMINNNSKIYFLVSGTKFSNKLGDFKVLLPNKYNHKLCNKLYLKIYTNTYISEFVKEYLSIFVNDDDIINVKKIAEIDSLIDTLILNTNGLFSILEMEMIKKEFKNFHNEMSIVFHNCESNEKNILFCGDALEKNLLSVKSQLHENYKLIKIPHHGTYDKYYFDYFPNTEIFLIFNGNGRCKEITCMYDNRYGNKTQFICSNKRCMKISHKCLCYSLSMNKAICGFNNYQIIII